jgi:uncharacterized SAM-binding protein YcdF (DUF218 family)
LAGVLACAYLCRGPLLRGLGCLLIVDEPQAAMTCLVLLGGDSRHDRAAELYHEGRAGQVLLIQRHLRRLEAFGIVPCADELDRRALRARGVPGSALTLVSGQAGDDWQTIRALRPWLQAHPGAHLHLVCERFGSRRLQVLSQRLLGPDAARVHLLALPSRDHDETNWWQHKEGLLDFLQQAMKLTYTWAAGERTAPWHDWDPDAYEAGLR